MVIWSLIVIFICIQSSYCYYLFKQNKIITKRIESSEQDVEAEKSLNIKKSNFLATMSHEIRTPLNGIVVAGKLMENETQTPRQKELSEIIISSGQLLANVVNDILDFSKIESGNLELDYQVTNLDKIVKEIIGTFKSQFDTKGLFLHFNICEELIDPVYSDGNRLKQILFNILGNAYKFTEHGGVSLKITKDGDYILFKITDSGIGMNETQLSRLFNEYEQADVTTQTKYGGTGLGLSISKKLTELLGGSISVESGEKKGTTFTFTIKNPPLPIDLKIYKEKEEKEDIDYSILKVLVADDNAINRTVAQMSLKKLGVDADFAVNGHDVVVKALEVSYDVIFMDIQMPSQSGIEACEELIEKIPFHEMPLVYALSASVFKETKDQCFNAGMSGFLSKPINLDILSGPLDLAIDRKNSKKSN
jgi:CheY-like chemotaxis protein/nitrogen-specific signal transduction histidine kinase